MDRRTVLLGSLGLAFSPGHAEANEIQQSGQKRFALILANQTYEKNPLPNIRNDALLMDKTLKGIGFKTTVVLDGTRTSMLDGIRRFKSLLAPGSFVLFYYSGHGAQVDGENYLIPTDNGKIDDADAAKDQCIPLGGPNGLLEKLGRTPGQLNLIILDACRDDPFPAATKSQGSKGLAAVARSGSGDYIAMAASPGQTASANPKGAYSLYTQELAKRIANPGMRLEDVFIETRTAVVSASRGKQVPQEFGTLTRKVYLAGVNDKTVTQSRNAPAVMESTLIRLEIKGAPDGATLKVDNVILEGIVFTDEITDKSKEVEVAVTAPGYRPYVVKVTLVRGESSLINVVLEPKAMAAKQNPVERQSDFPALRAYISNFCSVPRGTFIMGSKWVDSERPQHSVRISPFRMAATPVPVEVWKEYCVARDKRLPQSPSWGLLENHPIVNVSWHDIMGIDGKGGFCAWASEAIGVQLSLPTEAQWEYAARGGIEDQLYPWGNDFDSKRLWCSGKEYGDAGQTAAIYRGSNIYYNSYGIADMVGNVWEWCSDWYYSYDSESQQDPKGPLTTSLNTRSVRGASWLYFKPEQFRNSIRLGNNPAESGVYVGFRIVASSIP